MNKHLFFARAALPFVVALLSACSHEDSPPREYRLSGEPTQPGGARDQSFTVAGHRLFEGVLMVDGRPTRDPGAIHTGRFILVPLVGGEQLALVRKENRLFTDVSATSGAQLRGFAITDDSVEMFRVDPVPGARPAASLRVIGRPGADSRALIGSLALQALVATRENDDASLPMPVTRLLLRARVAALSWLRPCLLAVRDGAWACPRSDGRLIPASAIKLTFDASGAPGATELRPLSCSCVTAESGSTHRSLGTSPAVLSTGHPASL